MHMRSWFIKIYAPLSVFFHVRYGGTRITNHLKKDERENCAPSCAESETRARATLQGRLVDGPVSQPAPAQTIEPPCWFGEFVRLWSGQIAGMGASASCCVALSISSACARQNDWMPWVSQWSSPLLADWPTGRHAITPIWQQLTRCSLFLDVNYSHFFRACGWGLAVSSLLCFW